MPSVKYVSLVICIFAYVFVHLNIKNVQSTNNTIRTKRAITQLSEKSFKKQGISTASFTKVGSTRLNVQSWPKLVSIMFVNSFIALCTAIKQIAEKYIPQMVPNEPSDAFLIRIYFCAFFYSSMYCSNTNIIMNPLMVPN